MNNFEQFLVEFLFETRGKASPGGGQGAKGSTRLSGDSKRSQTGTGVRPVTQDQNDELQSDIQDKMNMVKAHFTANPDADGAAEHEKKGPDWVIPKKGKNKRKITNQVIVKKVSETIRGTESKAMLWLQARADKKKEADARKKAAQSVKGSRLGQSQPGLANAAKGLMGLSIRKPKK